MFYKFNRNEKYFQIVIVRCNMGLKMNIGSLKYRRGADNKELGAPIALCIFRNFLKNE